MEFNEIEFVLAGLLASAAGLAFLMYMGNHFLNSIANAKQRTEARLKMRSSTIISRRRIILFPGIVCSLPIHQEGRMEAPLSGK
jgi:hypothetical protein